MKRYKIVIVGAGPAGYFTAQAFQNAQNEEISFSIDMIERLPTPWGLVRSGVAPDHQKTKTVSKIFEKIAKENDFRLLANVELGKDVSLKDLRDQFDVVVLATGSSKGRKLGIPGEELNNSLSAAEFVPWYNAHPEYVDVKVDLSCDTAVVIGVGNVAIDVARILAIDPTALDPTDVADHALEKLKQANIRRVIICGRKGPEHATFTFLELRELLKLENVGVFIDTEQVEDATKRIVDLKEVEKDVKNNIEAMQAIAVSNKKRVTKKLEIKFLSTPIEIKGNGKVEEVVFTVNEVNGNRVVATNQKFSIKAGLVISAIGYEISDYFGIKVEGGRIVNIAGHVEHNIYTVGWAKRGPIGVIGNNKSDANDVVKLIISKLREPKMSQDITKYIKNIKNIVDQTGWEKINAKETVSGQIRNKPRLKITSWVEMFEIGRAKHSDMG